MQKECGIDWETNGYKKRDKKRKMPKNQWIAWGKKIKMQKECGID